MYHDSYLVRLQSRNLSERAGCIVTEFLMLAGGSARFGVGLHFLSVDGINGVVVQEAVYFGVGREAGENGAALIERGWRDSHAARGKAGKGLRDEGDVAALVAAAPIVACQGIEIEALGAQRCAELRDRRAVGDIGFVAAPALGFDPGRDSQVDGGCCNDLHRGEGRQRIRGFVGGFMLGLSGVPLRNN